MIATLIERLARTGLRKGFRQGSTSWAVIGVALSGVAILRRLSSRHRQSQVIAIEELLPGQSMTITAIDPSR